MNSDSFSEFPFHHDYFSLAMVQRNAKCYQKKNIVFDTDFRISASSMCGPASEAFTGAI